MIKKLSIFLVAVLAVASSLTAQPIERSGSAQFAPRAGQWQVNLVLGRGMFFEQENSTYLLPHVVSETDMGLPGGETKNGSGDPAYWFHIGSLNNNSITNVAGIQGKYFVTNRIEVNGMFSMDIGVQPQRSYTEGVESPAGVPGHPYITIDGEPVVGLLGGYQYVRGRLTNNWLATIGSNYYLNNCNGRIFPYFGVLGGFQHARIQVTMPWTNEVYTDPEADHGDPHGSVWADEIFAYARAGEVFGITGAITAGIEYNLLPGLNFAFEVRPVSYMYSLGRMYREGLNWNANAHSVRFFAMPQLKIGIRF